MLVLQVTTDSIGAIVSMENSTIVHIDTYNHTNLAFLLVTWVACFHAVNVVIFYCSIITPVKLLMVVVIK